jgi:four helix bundle protein
MGMREYGNRGRMRNMGMVGEDLRVRTKAFAVEIIRLVTALPKSQVADVLVRQVLRSATSVGANYRAACRSQSRGAFVAKISIVIEECDETQYWLELLNQLNLLGEEPFRRLYSEADELIAIFVTSKSTAKAKLSK